MDTPHSIYVLTGQCAKNDVNCCVCCVLTFCGYIVKIKRSVANISFPAIS